MFRIKFVPLLSAACQLQDSWEPPMLSWSNRSLNDWTRTAYQRLRFRMSVNYFEFLSVVERLQLLLFLRVEALIYVPVIDFCVSGLYHLLDLESRGRSESVSMVTWRYSRRSHAMFVRSAADSRAAARCFPEALWGQSGIHRRSFYSWSCRGCCESIACSGGRQSEMIVGGAFWRL